MIQDIKDETLRNNLVELVNKIPTMTNEDIEIQLDNFREWKNDTEKGSDLYIGYTIGITEMEKYLKADTKAQVDNTASLEENEVEEYDNEEIEGNENNEERLWLIPMNSSFIDCRKSDKNYMDYSALATLTYFSCRKSKEVCDMLGLDYSEVEEHRFIYENFIKENIEKFEELSGNKRDTIKRQINKLVKANNKVVSADYTESGELYYKIIPYVTKDNQLRKDGTYVTVESDILKFLINATNSNVIKVYCFLKWFLIDQKYYEETKKVRYIEKPIDRKFILKQIGLNSNSGKMASSISKDIEDMLVMTHLIERRKVTVTEFGKVKTKYYYSIVPHEEWKEFRKNVRENGIKK